MGRNKRTKGVLKLRSDNLPATRLVTPSTSQSQTPIKTILEGTLHGGEGRRGRGDVVLVDSTLPERRPSRENVSRPPETTLPHLPLLPVSVPHFLPYTIPSPSTVSHSSRDLKSRLPSSRRFQSVLPTFDDSSGPSTLLLECHG